MRVIRVREGQVREVAETGTDDEGNEITIETWRERFHPGIGEWRGHENAEAGWSWDGQDAHPPPGPSDVEIRRALIRYTAGLAQDKRRLAAGIATDSDDPEGEQWTAMTEAVLAIDKVTRSADDQADRDTLADLRAKGVAVKAVHIAARTIVQRLKTETPRPYNSTTDIDNAAEWP